ncbi:hypothetical protein ACEPAI_1282 [Sanghuangporus weigelae]
MALVAAHDWSNDMDSRQQRSHPNTDPANVNPAAAAAAAAQQSQSPGAYPQAPYGYPHPQQAPPAWHMGGMNMGQPGPGYFPPMQFYPQHYPHPQQQQQHPPQMHGGSPYGQPPQMFDPNAQFAQWAAYQQMMFNAQQSHQLSLSPSQSQQQQSQRGLPGSHPGSNAGTPTNEYYQTPFAHGRFQGSNTPPIQSSNNGAQYQGFHPYRRPERGERRPHAENSLNSNTIPFQPPYARSDATGSSTSVNSSSGASHRSRTNSGTSASGSARPQVNQQNSSKHTPRQSSTSSTTSTPRSGSSSSTISSSTLSTPGSTVAAPRTSRPSPLSQGSILSAAERRKSRDDSDLAAMFSSTVNLGDSSASTPVPRSGLKGRLRRALSLSAGQTLREEEEEASKANGKQKEKAGNGEAEHEGDASSMATKKTKKSLRMFNARFNASTDNISLSSTVSSASVMIRKLGSMGKLARRSSLAGITSLFKDKEKNKEGDEDGADSKGRKAKGKSRKADASVSHVTAEIDRSNDWSGPGMEGLSPAAKLARQHTLKSNAEAAARAKAQQEAQAATVAAVASGSGANGEALPTTWERNTATKHGVNVGDAREDGMRVVVEEDSDEEEGEMRRQSEELGSGSDDDSTWHGHGQEEDEDMTVRMTRDKGAFDEDGSNNGQADDDDDVLDEPWAMNCRRSIEKNLKPTRGILKSRKIDTVNYQAGDQPIGLNTAFMQRVRSNSYDSVPSHQQQELGPLAHMPPGDPDAIDGLHRHNSHRSTASTIKESATNGPPLLPPLQFDSPQTLAPSLSTSASTDGDKRSSIYNHPGLNNSEPTLSTITNNQPHLNHRSATTPAKRLAFAANLSIYDTFSSTTYDRRSEPATWSRLTPALAQRIKEELNSYKMEEMEVHAASRIHTQFFV